MNKISLIIPVYNADKSIVRCLQSCLQQRDDELDVEIIVVDDGSTDNSVARIAEIANQVPNIRLIKQCNKGVSAARNTGIDVASGDYIMFVDADDYLSPGAISSIVRMMQSDNVDVMAHGAIVEMIDNPSDSNGNIHNIVADSCMSGREYIRQNNGPYRKGFVSGAWGFIINRQALEKSGVRFFEGLPFGEDSLFYLYLILGIQRISAVSASFYHYVQNPDSVMHRSHDLLKIAQASLQRCIYNRKLTHDTTVMTDPELCDIISSRLIAIAFSRVFLRMLRERCDLKTAKEIEHIFENEGFWPLPELPKSHSPYVGIKALVYRLLRIPAIYNIIVRIKHIGL